MLLTRPMSLRALVAFELMGVRRITLWRRVSVRRFADCLLAQNGVAMHCMRQVAEGLDIDLRMQLANRIEPSHSKECFRSRVRPLLLQATNAAKLRGTMYLGTEHFFEACLKLDSSLFEDRTAEVYALYCENLTAFVEASIGQIDKDVAPSNRWPEWARTCLLRVEDFPESLRDDARCVVETFALYSRSELAREPAIQYALARSPQDVHELRERILEYFVSQAR